ncbi:MAG: hypothetical protein CM15mP49_02240 [Actinomycetota bacterium]|nr:MAG: hypothetical protein CM15mP49_02240 [Actinomycetota bacterium]
MISLCQGAFGLAGETNRPVPMADPDGEILKRMSQALVVGGKVALSAFSAYFQVHFLEENKDTFFMTMESIMRKQRYEMHQGGNNPRFMDQLLYTKRTSSFS